MSNVKFYVNNLCTILCRIDVHTETESRCSCILVAEWSATYGPAVTKRADIPTISAGTDIFFLPCIRLYGRLVNKCELWVSQCRTDKFRTMNCRKFWASNIWKMCAVPSRYNFVFDLKIVSVLNLQETL